jgi:hypothetical protein
LRFTGVSTEWREDKEGLGRFIAPKGLPGFSPGFQPRETSNETVRPERAQVLTGSIPHISLVKNEFRSIFGGENDVHQDKDERLSENVRQQVPISCEMWLRFNTG